MTVLGIIYYFQHLPFNLAGGEQDFQEQREGLPLIVNMLEPWMVAGGFQAPLLIPTDGRTRESFFRWLHAQTNSSGEPAMASLNIHSKQQHTHKDKTQKKHNTTSSVQIFRQTIKLYRKKMTFTSFPNFSNIEQSAPVPLKPQWAWKCKFESC